MTDNIVRTVEQTLQVETPVLSEILTTVVFVLNNNWTGCESHEPSQRVFRKKVLFARSTQRRVRRTYSEWRTS